MALLQIWVLGTQTDPQSCWRVPHLGLYNFYKLGGLVPILTYTPRSTRTQANGTSCSKTKGAFPYDVLKGRYLKHLKHTVPLSFPMASARFCLHCIGHKKKGTAYFQHPRTKQRHNLQCWRTKQTERTFTKGFIELFTVAHRNFMRKR